MSLIISKQIVLMALILSLCNVCTGNVQEAARLIEEQRQELIDSFVDKVEYVYNFDLWFTGDDLFFAETGYRERALQVDLYWKDGAYYFIPIEDCNTELEIKGMTRPVKYNIFNEEHYIFCVLRQRNGIERDNGRWYLQKDTSVRMDEIEELTYLGMVEIDSTGEKEPVTMKLTENGYIHAIIDSIKDKGNGQLPVGDYKIYIGLYEYYDAVDRVTVTGVIRQNETYRFFAGSAIRREDGSYDGSAYSTNGASEWFPTIEEIPSAKDSVMHIVEAERLVIDLKITGQEKQQEEKAAVTEQSEEEMPKTAAEVTEVTEAEAKKKIEELYNYYQWFYGKMPYDIESLLEEGETYSIFTDGNGGIFWIKKDDIPSNGIKAGYSGIYRSELQSDIADLPLYSYMIGNQYCSDLREIGSMDWHKTELRKPALTHLVEDGYIREVETYIRSELTERGKNGKYQIYFGRYEIMGRDVRSISVAVTGDETFYLQCWVTKYADGTYECLPVGGSYMGEKKTGLEKASRIIQLDRLKIELEINEI